MTTEQYNKLDSGPIDQIDAAVFSGDTFFDRENIAAFRAMMARWEKGLQATEDILANLDKHPNEEL